MFRFCRPRCRKLFHRKKNPRKARFTKAHRKVSGKELTVDPSLEFAKRRNVPIKYNREFFVKSLEAIRKIDIIRRRRANHFVMQRLRKATEVEFNRDVRMVKRDMHLIRLPVADMQERRKQAESATVEEIHDSDGEMEEIERVLAEEESDMEEDMDSDVPELVEAS